MRFFNLPLAARLALAVLSGILTFPVILLDSAAGPDSYPPIFSWWLILQGVVFGLLVMAPFVNSGHFRELRVAALVVASVFSYDAAIKIPDFIEIVPIGNTGDFIIAGISGALLVATAVRFIAPLRVGLPYWGFSFLAGLIGGYVFSLTFEVCDWDRCTAAWMILPYASGWIAWQSLVCLAMFQGARRTESMRAAYGLSMR